MALFDIFKRKAETSTIDRQIRQALVNIHGGGLIPLTDDKESYIEKGYNSNLFVYAIVSYIASKAAEIPIVLERITNRDAEEVTDHPFLRMMQEQPNELQDWNELMEQSIGFYLLTGDAYLLKVLSQTRQNDPVPIEMFNLPAQFMEIDTTSDSLRSLIKSYKVNLFQDVHFAPREVIHYRTPTYSYENGEWLYGTSPLKAGLRTLNLSNSTTDAMTKQAQNQGALGLLMYDLAGNGNETITQEKLDSFKTKLKDAISGTDNRGRAVALAKMFKWQQLGMTAADMQLLEDHNLTRNDLCAAYNISAQLFGDNSASTFNNVKEAKKSAYTEAIIPAAKKFVNALNKSIIKPTDKNLRLRLDLSGIEVLKDDNSQLITTLQNAWFVPTSEKQKMVGITPDGVLPEYLLPSNLIPMDLLTDEQAKKLRVEIGDKEYQELEKKYQDYVQSASNT